MILAGDHPGDDVVNVNQEGALFDPAAGDLHFPGHTAGLRIQHLKPVARQDQGSRRNPPTAIPQVEG
jgi:hypothetical protein